MQSPPRFVAPSRREFLGATVAAGALGGGVTGWANAEEDVATAEYPKGSAEHCIMIWLGGGPAQIDTFDPKKMGDAKTRKPGSYYESVPTAIEGARVCKHLERSAPLLDRATLLRTVHHNVIDEHAAAVNRMHTGRPTSGTIVYPSIGSIVSHELPPGGKAVPKYVVMGYPSLTRGPGFLGAGHSYIYLTQTETGPTGLTTPPGLTRDRLKRREALLARLRSDFKRRNAGDEVIGNYAEVAAQALRLTGPDFMSAFNLDSEADSLRKSYGSEFGQRCLLARRLVERGVRFIEVAHNLNFVNGTGWDTHNQGQLNQHVLIDELDSAFSTLLVDLEKRKLLDKTLIVIAGEFGRPAEFDAGGGRGHQSTAFSAVLAGGGLKNGRAIGETDELAKKIVSRPVSVPDLFSTIYCSLGINPGKVLYAGVRPVPITDLGKPIGELFS